MAMFDGMDMHPEKKGLKEKRRKTKTKRKKKITSATIRRHGPKKAHEKQQQK